MLFLLITRARANILLIMFACTPAYCADWLVDPNGDSAADDLFISLEDAIASDKVSGGDTLTLRPGNYVHENELVLNKALTIQGDGAPGRSFLSMPISQGRFRRLPKVRFGTTQTNMTTRFG